MSTVYGQYAAYGLGSDTTRDWRADALCRDVDPETWFPTGSSGPALDREETAKRICRGCPSRLPCLKYAVDNDITDGVWGGLGELERRQQAGLRTRRRKTHCRRGHEFTEANTYYILPQGWRMCRTCQKQHRSPKSHPEGQAASDV